MNILFEVSNNIYTNIGSVNLRKTLRFKTTIYSMRSRNRTSSQIIGYGLYLYFLELSFRNTAKTLSFLLLVKSRIHLKLISKVQTKEISQE